MAKKVIQVPVDEGLLKDLDNLSRKQRKARSEVIREACFRYLQEIQHEELDRLYQQGYVRIPEEPGTGEIQIVISGEFMTRESWQMRRGEVWWAELPQPIGRRPVLLLSRDAAYSVRMSVTVAAIARTIRNIPTEVLLEQKDGMPAKCVTNLDDILTIPKGRLTERITTLSPEKMTAVAKAIVFALDLRI